MANSRMIHPYPGMFVASARADGSIRSIRPDYFEWLKKKDAMMKSIAGKGKQNKDRTGRECPARQISAD